MSPIRINLSSRRDVDHRKVGNVAWNTGFLQPRYDLRCDARTLRTVATVGRTPIKHWDDPLEALSWMSRQFPSPKGRWIGHLNYELGRLFERLPAGAVDDLNIPLFHFTFCDPRQDRPGTTDPLYELGDQSLHSTFTRQAYESAVRRSLDYIEAGDIFQVNLAQRFSLGLREQPGDIYYRLVRDTPAQYGAFLSYDDYALISNSPELFLRVTPDRRVITRPIKGTRPRQPGMDIELRDSVKDQAELNMIVDLERNDLGRVCEVGSVHVTEPRVIEAHPTIYHGVATIEGTLRENATFVDLLRATFPGGSITGAPKIRAMEIIDELELVARGPYCGAIGYLDADGTIELNIAIRTMIVKDGLVHISVGGGIVADSNPAAEYEETLVKAKAMFAALEVNMDELR